MIQNAFPVIVKFFDHIHTVENKSVKVHNELNRILMENLGEVLALYNRGIYLIFTDIDKIRTIMEQELENTVQVRAFFSRDGLHLIWRRYFIKSAYLLYSCVSVKNRMLKC